MSRSARTVRATRRWMAAVAGSALMAGLLAGCTTARSDLGTSDSSCYLTLPTATKAVHGQGRLLGVRGYTLKSLRHQAPDLFGKLGPGTDPQQRVCVVAFGGGYSTDSVSKPSGRSSGGLAVVVATTPENRLLGTIILTRPPLRFGHVHIG